MTKSEKLELHIYDYYKSLSLAFLGAAIAVLIATTQASGLGKQVLGLMTVLFFLAFLVGLGGFIKYYFKIKGRYM